MITVQQEFIDIIRHFQTISPEAKAMMALEIEDGELEPDFFEIFESILDDEIAFAENNIGEINSELQQVNKEKEEEKKRILPHLKKVKAEYVEITAKLLEEYENNLRNHEKKSSEKLEKTVQEKIEGADISALHSFLSQPKKPDSAAAN